LAGIFSTYYKEQPSIHILYSSKKKTWFMVWKRYTFLWM